MLWFLGPETERQLERQLVLLSAFIDAYGPSTLDLRSFGARTAARAERERVMHERAGRPSPPGSWLHQQIVWLSTNTGRFDRWALATF
ncbi:hypothetical protein GCM10011519_14810 [Marmoricola endophyticus]|uniref:Uncharacterized protein n=1 Tax=Marmoricola endophyticus TaxID=2040280 RepID=A0A917F1Y8_9ACTN|nr:hypothetical protein GCM10011519_14810 [Marmoricola endophyticus]